MTEPISREELGQHNKDGDLWIALNGKVYDFSDFPSSHPGGPEVIYRYAGQDASEEYNTFHAPELVKSTLGADKMVGYLLDVATAGSDAVKPASSVKDQKPLLDELINLYDLEEVAKRTLTAKAWAYIDGASNDNLTCRFNNRVLRHIWFRPAVMRGVRYVNMSTTLFGCKLDAPIYISPTAAVSVAGTDGELAQARGAASSGIIATIPNMASHPLEDILDATPERAFFQLYVSNDRQQSEDIVHKVTASGKIKAIFVTVDSPVVSKREADERTKGSLSSVNPYKGSSPAAAATAASRKGPPRGGFARQSGQQVDPSISWSDLAWLRSITDLPLVLKGVQRHEDAVKAMELGFEGIVLSNHGGRAADNALPAILTLLELHRNCPQVFGAMEILVDGGFRRGSDVVKAICLGASAVGLGRPFMYSVMYGQEGTERVVDILKDEIRTCMQLIGICDLFADASPDYLVTGEIDHLVRSGQHPYAKKITRRSRI
ncbi:Cytochrome b2-like protein [Fusarium keratoplasticum]|nr:Cytochrome b2-like protein [Fusarium keratoplasticum]